GPQSCSRPSLERMKSPLPLFLPPALVITLMAGARFTARGNDPSPAPGAGAKMLGFTEAHADAQAALEKKFDAHISADDQKNWMEQMASAPNHVGSPHDKANADFMLARFKEWGWDTRIETFQ